MANPRNAGACISVERTEDEALGVEHPRRRGRHLQALSACAGDVRPEIADERMPIGKARCIAHRRARDIVANLRANGGQIRTAWLELTSLAPRQHCGWRDIEALIAAMILADLIRAKDPARLAA